MSVKISKQFATVLICMVLKPAVGMSQMAHENVFRSGLSRTAKAQRGTWEAGSLELIRLLTLRRRTPTELLYMLVQIDSVCSSEQSRENYVTVNDEIKLPTSLIKS